MAKKRRPMEVFSMSFLDCMSCGFGAVILFFMIINSQVTRDVEAPPEHLLAETTKLEFEILEERKNLVLARNTMEDLEDEQVRAKDQIAQIIALIEQLKAELEEHDADTLAKIKRIEKLQSDIKSLEEERKRLLELERQKEEEGAKVRRFAGDGRPSVPYRSEGGRRERPHSGRFFSKHARQKNRQHHSPPQHVG